MLAPNRIRFCGVFSNELNMHDLIMDCAFDSDDSEVSTFLTREAVASESYDGRTRRISSFKYTENFAPKFSFLKNDFGDFTQDEVRALLKYLTQRDTTGLLEVYDDDSNVISWASIGNFSEIQLYKIANKRVVGVTATWDSISPFAMSDVYTVLINETKEYEATINIDTDDNKPVYPTITIQQKGTVVNIPQANTLNLYSDMIPNTVYYNGTTYYWKSDASSLCTGTTEPSYGWSKIIRDTVYKSTDEIKNDTIYYYTSDQKYRWIDPYTFKLSSSNPGLATTGVKIINRHYDIFDRLVGVDTMTINNNTATEKIEVDVANKIISSTNTSRILGNNFNWNWLPLYEGKNELVVEGNCEVKIEYREIRKIGEY